MKGTMKTTVHEITMQIITEEPEETADVVRQVICDMSTMYGLQPIEPFTSKVLYFKVKEPKGES